MRVLIVDDEPLARSALEQALRGRSDIETLDSAKDAIQALEMMQESKYDVLLLDIGMPELSGIDLADRLNKSNQPIPSIIFVTAHDQHAIAAFENHAVDYVLKPFSSARINRALNVAFRRTENDRAARLLRTLPLLEISFAKPSSKVAIKAKGRILFIDPAEVAVIRAEGNYLRFFSPGAEYRRRGTLRDLEGRLDPACFLRLNRSEIVRLEAIRELQPWFHGDARVILHDGSVLTWSRRYRARAEGLF